MATTKKTSKKTAASTAPVTLTWQLAPGLQLCPLPTGVKDEAVPTAAPPTHHVIVLDCSGSMSSDMPALREQLKKKLVTLMGERDTASIVWFSGRGEAGALIENMPVGGLRDLDKVSKIIDRWVRPVGLTGFVDPLTIAAATIDKVDNAETAAGRRADTRARHSLIFMSDGCDNQWQRHEIIAAISKLSTRVHAATFVEYGYYADKLLLAQMAAKCAGRLVFARDFNDYEPEFAGAMGAHAERRIALDVRAAHLDVITNTVWCIDENGVTTCEVDSGGTAMVPANARLVWCLANGDGAAHDIRDSIDPELARIGGDDSPASALYAALSVFATRGMPDVILPVLRALGDVAFIKRYTGLFGKQAYSAFQVDAARAALDPDLRLRDGYNPALVPSDDAFTVMDLLTMLSLYDECRILFEHPAFRYSRIGRKRVDATVGDVPKLKFERTPMPEGVPCNSLVFNENRANVSVNVRHEGFVDLSGRLPAGAGEGAVPMRFPTHQFRSYSIIADGLVNVSRLPITVPPETLRLLVEAGVPMDGYPDALVVKLDELPVMDRRDADGISAASLLADQWQLEQLRCAQKVYKNYRDAVAPEKVDASFAAKYGDVAATWLTEQGFDSGQGYAPPSTKQVALNGDYYLAKLVTAKIPGFSKLPTVADAAAGKGGTAGKQMALTIEECKAKMKSMPAAEFARWVTARAESTIMDTRALLRTVAKQKLAVIVAQKWFPEFPTVGEGSLELSLGPVHGNKKVSCKFEMEEKKVLL